MGGAVRKMLTSPSTAARLVFVSKMDSAVLGASELLTSAARSALVSSLAAVWRISFALAALMLSSKRYSLLVDI